MNIKNLIKYNCYLRDHGHSIVAMMVPYNTGEYVKFKDVEELYNNRYEIAIELYEEYMNSKEYNTDTNFKLWCKQNSKH